MTTTLSREHRRSLETIVARAREAAESGAAKALQALGVGASAAPGHLTPAQAALRVALRAHGRQIGDKALPDAATSSKAQSVDHLVVEVAYEHWHRMLFARFLAESDLLLHPDGYPVSLADCKEDAPSLTPPARSAWEVAGRYASAMLPQVFRAGSPALALALPIESEQALEALLASLPPEVFAADDSLGWSYQFWQAPRKEVVQRQMKQAGTKVGADELPAVTQLFTEPYMVAFLLENALGAWWQTRRPGQALPVAMPYLRTLADGTPAAGDFAAWPDSLASFKLLDPCLGSGHFLVAVLHYLVPLRMVAEGLSAKEAVDRVLRDNLHGLELDPRCVEIAAFALALAAWRYPGASGQMLGYRPLPRLNLACVGVAPRSKKGDWLQLAGGDQRLEEGMGQLYELFQKAPELGSLIDPGAVAAGGLFDASWDELADLLDLALSGASASASASVDAVADRVLTGGWVAGRSASCPPPAKRAPPLPTQNAQPPSPLDGVGASDALEDRGLTGSLDGVVVPDGLEDRGVAGTLDGDGVSDVLEARVSARGMVDASRILSRRYHLVVTNPPYLGAGQHGAVLKAFCEAHYKAAKGDLANVFLQRCLALCVPGGAVSFVMPQNWLFLKTYQKQREQLLNTAEWNLLARLGSGAFETITGEVVNAILLTLTHQKPFDAHLLRGLDASAPKTPEEKARLLAAGEVVEVGQAGQLGNPDARVVLDEILDAPLLAVLADSSEGLSSGDGDRFIFQHWELDLAERGIDVWEPLQEAPDDHQLFAGLSAVVRWERGKGELAEFSQARIQGQLGWGRKGILVSEMRNLWACVHVGHKHYKTAGVVVPIGDVSVEALYVFCTSAEYLRRVRQVDTALKVAPKSLVRVPFESKHWQAIAAERYPNGLPKPYSDDPTQWIFHGHPKPATDPLQVAVARLLGYRWPAETDAAMELSSEARAWVARCQDLHSLADDDGILCLPAVRGEAAAVDRLRAMLSRAFGADWTVAREAKCIKDAGCDGLPLSQWLRDKFFEQHVARFHKRPFIWHVWCGHKDGFSALLNVHTLTRAKLQTLIHTYLGDWITQQRRAIEAGGAQAGEATLKLAKAELLKTQLEAILHGEKPFDIFVRWKPLHQQPLGWEPDLNDGVRMAIRPWVQAGVLRINAAKLGIKWDADRGKDVPTAPWYKLGPTYGEPEGTRINDHHLSLAEKQAARDKVAAQLAAKQKSQ